MKTMVFVEKLEINEHTNPSQAATQRTFCRPHVSNKNPQKYDVDTMPRNETDAKAPCSAMLNFISHFAYGRM